ncbi:uncharacterized protein LOC133792355 [Humulus lupulus]|uniref:uncharacterized protein LOC133792355 n=1 Tax=Humulus lupulus TaxID=3486 RepID=UPI002B4155F5|nr:uncharacterized protein LOC133792355 [Humulus lupulus]
MWESNNGPKITTILEKNKVEARSHIPTKSHEFIYQVMNMYGGMYSIDLQAWVCSCRRWKHFGIPGSHVIAAIWHRREDLELYVSKWYIREYYMKAYSVQIFPIRNQDEWPRSGNVGMIKPIGKTQHGRPKKSRRVELDEIAPSKGKKLKRRYVRMRCCGCGAVGHNFRTCARNIANSASVSSTTNESGLTGIISPPQVPFNPPRKISK